MDSIKYKGSPKILNSLESDLCKCIQVLTCDILNHNLPTCTFNNVCAILMT